MKILEIIMFIAIGAIVCMLHFVSLSMLIENHSTTHIIVFCVIYPVIGFMTYIYVLAINYYIVDEILEKWKWKKYILLNALGVKWRLN